MIRSDFVTINERRARYYGIPDRPRGDGGFAGRAGLRGVRRGEIVTQASILTTPLTKPGPPR